MNLNKVLLIGRLGTEPESKTFNSGDRIVNVNLGVNDPYWSDEKNHWVQNTSWIRCTFSNKIADRALELHTGDEILVEGKLKTRSYEDKNGNKQFTFDVRGTFKKGRPGKQSRGESKNESGGLESEINEQHQNARSESQNTQQQNSDQLDESDDLQF